MSKISILMVDDHPIVREGMALFLNMQPDLDLRYQAGTADEALALLAEHCPALAIVDISLTKDSGLDLIKVMRRRDSSLPILAMSLHDESIFAERALRAGANGYLMKHEATANILRAVRQVMAGDIYLSIAMHNRLARRVGSQTGAAPGASVSEREFEVLHLLALGFGSRQVSEKLNRSIKTIESHRASLKRKFGLQTSADLVRFAARWLDERGPCG